jgi:hypothetical protein
MGGRAGQGARGMASAMRVATMSRETATYSARVGPDAQIKGGFGAVNRAQGFPWQTSPEWRVVATLSETSRKARRVPVGEGAMPAPAATISFHP